MIRDRVKELTDLARRLSADIDQMESEKLTLRKEIANLKLELAKNQGAKVPERLHQDCQNCLYRLRALELLGTESKDKT
jgi:hypothetical protein